MTLKPKISTYINKFLTDRISFFIVGAFFFLSLFLYGISHPELNWDIIGYTAASHYQQGRRGDELRKTTYKEVQELAEPGLFKELTGGSLYRKTVFENSESLEQQMPFYTIRMAYVWTMQVTSKIFGISVAKSTYFISSFFASLCVLFLFYLFKPKKLALTLVFLAITIFAGFKNLAMLSTPDSMAAFFVLLTIFYFQKKMHLATLLLLTLIPFIRTDFIIFAGLLAFLLFTAGEKLKAVLLVVPPLLVYLLINRFNSNYGYLKIFNFTLIGTHPFPATMEIKITLKPYIDAYMAGFLALLRHKHFILYSIYTFFWLKYVRPKKIQNYNDQFVIVFGFVSLHMILFPAYFDRFFVWCVAIAGLQLASWIYQLKWKKDVDIN